jgi:glycosyltransferase involved in cell wall biosynthesis
VVDSFLERGFTAGKLFRNPYGVDLKMFPPICVNRHSVPAIIFVGTWSWRKGVDVLLAAFNLLNGVRLIHVGPVSEGPDFPSDPLFRHVDPVPQWQLKEYYGMADVFVHASREEGLSLVQAQALACGLPLVCTDRTGGEDLRSILSDSSLVTVVPHDDPVALAAAIRTGLAKAATLTGLRDGLGPARESLSWSAYGRRYGDFLEARVSAGKGVPCA